MAAPFDIDPSTDCLDVAALRRTVVEFPCCLAAAAAKDDVASGVEDSVSVDTQVASVDMVSFFKSLGCSRASDDL